MNIPFLSLDEINKELKSEFFESFSQLYDSNNFILGPNVELFESMYAKYNETKYCVSVGNGLDAITLSIKALDIGKGDEIIVPANTFIASLIAISNSGATPVLIDCNVEDYNIDYNQITSLITSKTKAVLAVNLYGQPCSLNKIDEICEENGIYLIEDNAQSQGAKDSGRLAGSVGVLGCTSFYPGKNLGALGDGGAITTNSKYLYEKLLKLRNYGSSVKYKHELIGVNSRLDEVQAIFLSIKLKRLNKWNKSRNELAEIYFDKLKGIENVVPPSIRDGVEHVFHLFVVRVEKREELQAFLKKNGITTLIHYPIPCHMQPSYSYLRKAEDDYPVAFSLSKEILSLPLYIGLTEEDIGYICAKIKEFYLSYD